MSRAMPSATWMTCWTPAPSPSARATSTPQNAAGTEPAHRAATSRRCTVPRRRCTTDPTGFMIAADTRSLDTAVSGGTPNSSTSTGVIRAPPPIPVRPTTIPTPAAASAMVQSTSGPAVRDRGLFGPNADIQSRHSRRADRPPAARGRAPPYPGTDARDQRADPARRRTARPASCDALPPLAGDMSLTGILDAALDDPALARARDLAAQGQTPTLDLTAHAGSWSTVVAALAAAAPRGAARSVLAVTATGREAEDLANALRCFLPGDVVVDFPAWETLPHERLSPRSDTVGRRLAVLRRLAHPDADGGEAGPVGVPVAPIRAVIQPLVAVLGELVPVRLHVGDNGGGDNGGGDDAGLEQTVEALV